MIVSFILLQPKFDIEHTEMLLYQNLILRNQGKTEESVDHFEKFFDIMTDKLKVKEIKGKNIILSFDISQR